MDSMRQNEYYLKSTAKASTMQFMPTSSQSQKERDQKRLWVANNRGVLSSIARALDPPCSPSAVHSVLYYNLPSKGFRIEKALADAGAPYMKIRLHERMAVQRERVA
jgi:hypothetical protein